MAELSIIELVVYGLIGYSGVLMLISSAFRDLPSTKSQSAVRAIWVIPCIITLGMLANAGDTINFDVVSTINTITDNATSTVVFTEDITKTTTITLVQPVWIVLHLLFFIMMIIYFIWNILQLFVKRD